MIRLVLPYPMSANRYWHPVIIKGKGGAKGHVTIVPTAEAKAFKQEIGWLCARQGVRQPIAGPVEVDLVLYPHQPLDWAKRAKVDPLWWDLTVRSIDLDNARKVLFDALKAVAFSDDAMVRKDSGVIAIPDGEARVELVIKPYEREHPQAALFDAGYDARAHQAAAQRVTLAERLKSVGVELEKEPF